MSKADEFKKWFSERMGHSDPLKLAKEAIEELQKENELMAEQLNQLSEVLLGYREGSFFEMVSRANHLKLKSTKCRD